MSDLTPFARAAAVTPVDSTADREARFAADLPADWAQGRTAFGGLSAAIAINALVALPELAELPFRAVDAAFVGPVPPGPVTVTARVLRRGKYLTHAAAELLDETGQPLTRLHAVLGELRPSSVSVSPTPPDPVPRDQCMEMPHLPGITPDFARNFTMSFATGIPFTGSTEPRITGWCRHLTPAVGVAAVSALVDAWPGSVLPVLTRPAPASTVRWSLQFPGASDVAADEWCWYENETVTAQGGYSTMTARLWQDGRLLSWSEQVLTVFERPAEG